MGMIDRAMSLLFGGQRRVARDTIEVFRENAEGRATRDADHRRAVLDQFAAEFDREASGRFDRFMDGVNRVPRPAMALGTLGLFVAAMVDPAWFSARMAGLASVPEPLWWLLGAIVSFYFGARHQVKGQQFRRSLLRAAAAQPPATAPEGNAALDDWRAARAG